MIDCHVLVEPGITKPKSNRHSENKEMEFVVLIKCTIRGDGGFYSGFDLPCSNPPTAIINC